MRKMAQIAYSGPSGAADLCVTLALAGQKAGTPQTIAFWGIETPPADRLKRCAEGGLEVAVFDKKIGTDAAGQKGLREWAAQLDVDAIIIHYPAAMMALRGAFKGRRKPRLILVEHNANSQKRVHHWLLSALAFWLCDGIVYLTENYRDQVARRLGPLFRSQKTRVIANGLDLALYESLTVGSSTQDAFIIGMSGRMVPVKDYSTLMEALALLPADSFMQLEFAGDGPMRAELEAKAQALGIGDRVKFLGNLPHQKLIERMWTWDAFALSTQGETQSLAIMEAMASGLPCISTEAPGIKEMITNGVTGLLVPVGDAARLATVLQQLCDDPLLASRLAAAGLAQAKSIYSSERMRRDYYDYIANLI